MVGRRSSFSGSSSGNATLPVAPCFFLLMLSALPRSRSARRKHHVPPRLNAAISPLLGKPEGRPLARFQVGSNFVERKDFAICICHGCFHHGGLR